MDWGINETNFDKIMVKLTNHITNSPFNYPGDDEDIFIDANVILDELSDSGESELGELVFKVEQDQINAYDKSEGKQQFSIYLG